MRSPPAPDLAAYRSSANVPLGPSCTMDIAAQSSKGLPLPHPSGQRLSTKRALAVLTVTLALFSGAAIFSPVHARLGGSQAVFTSRTDVCGVVDAATLTVVTF